MTRGHRMKTTNKKPDVVYHLYTPFIEFLEDLRRIDICPESRVVYEDAYAKHPDYTLGQIIDEYPLTQGWARSQLLVYDGQLGEDVRKKYFDFIDRDVVNYLLWKDLKHITSKERNTLRNKFRGRLPNIERKLDDSN